MLHIGCSGFPVPATRYFREFEFTEVADTLIGVPGPALVRRWLREASPNFVFAALAPREVSQDAFKPSAAAESAWEAFAPVARDLSARAIVVTSPADVTSSKVTRAAARAMLEWLNAKQPVGPIVWEPPPTWELKESEALAKDAGAIVARDPAKHPPVAKGALAYFRLPGPAGHKSRYEDPMLEAAAKTVRESRATNTIVTFANVDMHADAKRLRMLLEPNA